MIRAFGEAAVLVDLGETSRVHALADALRATELSGVVHCVPGIDTVLIELDPLAVDPATVAARVQELLDGLPERPVGAGRHRSIPVVYGDEFGPDLDEVASLVGLPADEVVARHAGGELVVEILGFAPGFPYLGTLPPELEVPRLATPRTRTPAGSVGIAGRRTGIYPAELPGGWRVIGRTPVTLFDPQRDPPAYLALGDTVRFEPISPSAFQARAGVAADW